MRRDSSVSGGGGGGVFGADDDESGGSRAPEGGERDASAMLNGRREAGVVVVEGWSPASI